jgi:hypothetical protein
VVLHLANGLLTTGEGATPAVSDGAVSRYLVTLAGES